MKIKELYSDPSKWTQGWYAKRADGSLSVWGDYKEAVCWCLLGAIRQCYPDNNVRIGIFKKVQEKIGTGIPYWNDNPERKFEEVKALVEELDI